MIYSNPNSPSWQLGPTHPATTYEMIGDVLIIGIMALLFAKLWRTRPGVTFFTGVVLYSAMRFGVSYLRVDSHFEVKDWDDVPAGGLDGYVARRHARPRLVAAARSGYGGTEAGGRVTTPPPRPVSTRSA